MPRAHQKLYKDKSLRVPFREELKMTTKGRQAPWLILREDPFKKTQCKQSWWMNANFQRWEV